jgi:hypothetical protein
MIFFSSRSLLLPKIFVRKLNNMNFFLLIALEAIRPDAAGAHGPHFL